MLRAWLLVSTLLSVFLELAVCKITTSESSSSFTVANDRLTVGLTKNSGKVTSLALDGFDLLGSGSQGLYLDCYCVPDGFYTVGSSGHTNSTLVTGTDSTGTDYAGLIVSDVYTATNQTFQQFWFLRDGETGLHAFSHLTYYNSATPFLRNLQELRTLFRPIANHYEYLSINDHIWSPLPSADAVAKEEVAQDATWWLGNTPNDAYYSEFAEYFTKYTFANAYKDMKAHGMFTKSGESTYGAWLVWNSKDTYFGGPLHSDLLTDGIVYNYLSSNHHGNGVPNITHGFDRTFGPQYYYFNSIDGGEHADLRADAESLADPSWDAAFYDSIADLVPNLVPSSGRGTLKASVNLPPNAKNAVAILTVSGQNHQDNTVDTQAYQYWKNITGGAVAIPRVKAGSYRLTILADGIFGEYVKDDVVIQAGATQSLNVNWQEESAGTEIFRLGTPDRSSGEYKRGNAPDTTHDRRPEQYRIYWGQYNFTDDFPNGVNFTIGESNESEDWNYAHWSIYGPTFKDDQKYVLNPNWTINFDLDSSKLPSTVVQATWTIQLAAASTASGNTDEPNGSDSNFNLATYINSNGPLNWYIQWFQSSSCAKRSGVSCYNLSTKMNFPVSWLHTGRNEIKLNLPYNSAAISVQYDALRLEIV